MSKLGKALKQEVVQFEDKFFWVSTINRQSSAIAVAGVEYAETMVFKTDAAGTARDGIVGQGEHARDSLFTHDLIVERLKRTGKVEEDDE